MREFAARPRFLALIGWTVIVGYPLTSYLFTSPAAREHPIVAVCQELGEDDCQLVASDIPWFIAWYGEKTALLIPQNERELSRLREAHIEPDSIYLSPAIMQMPPTEEMQYWQRILIRGQDFGNFRRMKEWKSGGGFWQQK